MKLLQAKLAKYTAPQEAKAAGVYPYFRAWMYGEEEANALVSTIYIIVAFVAGAYSENASFSPP